MHKPDEKNRALNAPDHGLVTSSQANPQIGYETTDVKVTGVLVFLLSLAAFILVFFVFCFGMGKVINNALVKRDGAPSKWNKALAAPHARGKSLQSTAAMEQQQLQTMTQRFPTPRLQMDDGNQDLADMHQREDLLLDHYTWVDKQQGVVRIPIEQAMQMIVQKGLPVAPQTSGGSDTYTAQESAQDAARISAPLTNGFARTTYEQEEQTQNSVVGRRKPSNEVSSIKSRSQAGGVQ